jgi:hypothetical protein
MGLPACTRLVDPTGTSNSLSASAPTAALSTAFINARVQDLLEQQAALRDLAVAVAEMRAPEVIYELVAKQAAAVAGLDSGAVVRFRVDGVAEVVGSWHMGSRQVGTLLPLDGADEVGSWPAPDVQHASTAAGRGG